MSLVLRGVEKRFGGLRAVHEVSLSVEAERIFGLIGPNGAGKTTLFNLVTGIYPLDSGSIMFDGEELGGKKPAQIAAAGIARTFQNIRVFGQLTVLENLLVAGEAKKRAGLRSAILPTRASHGDDEKTAARARELLKVFDLGHAEDQEPTALSYGNQRRLEIARAMMLSPKLLLLDEPAAGMNYGEAEGLNTQIRWLRDTFKLSVVLVEHNMQVVMRVSDEIHVLDHGETLAHGAPADIRRDPRVLAAYLGQEPAPAATVLAV
jgi:branched-chain amino acid transport system ATP-binding protein